MGACYLLSRAGSNHEYRGLVVFLLSRTATTPVVGDMGASNCRDLTMHIVVMVIRSGHHPQLMAIRRKSEKDR